MRMALSRRSLMKFDTWMWLFTRLSGLAMILTAVLGLVGALAMGARLHMDLPSLMRWVYFPNPYHVANSDIPDVAQGWISAYWQILQMAVVFFGATHGFNGLRVVMEDYVHARVARLVLRGVILVLWAWVLAAGISIAVSG